MGLFKEIYGDVIRVVSEAKMWIWLHGFDFRTSPHKILLGKNIADIDFRVYNI